MAVTVRDIGLTPWSASGTAECQAWMAELAASGVFGNTRPTQITDWRTEADRILAHIKKD